MTAFYFESRKLTAIETQTNLSYEYVVDYDILHLLNLDNTPCKEELSWNEDECKMTEVTLSGSFQKTLISSLADERSELTIQLHLALVPSLFQVKL